MDLTESLPAHSSPDYVMPEPVAGFGYDGNKEVHSIMISYAPEHMNELSVAQHGRNSEVTSKGPALDSHPTITVDNTYLCPPSPISTRSDISCDAMMISAKSLDNDLWCKPPNHDELNEEQKAILSDYPSDLDTEYKSLYASFFRGILQWRSYVKWRYTHYYLVVLFLIAIAACVSIFHTQLIHWLRPISLKVRTVLWGWIIPVLVLFALSFPPLFGGEIIAVLCGIVYGVWVGFGIVALGTFLGELGNFYLFRYLLQKPADKIERKSLMYACFAEIIRNGNFFLALATRLSAIPSHITTAVFATVGMGFWTFVFAAIFSLPKYLAVVYLGVALDGGTAGGQNSKSSRAVQISVVVFIAAVTVGIAGYLWYKMDRVRVSVQARLKKERFERLIQAAHTYENSSALSSPCLEVHDPILNVCKTKGDLAGWSEEEKAFGSFVIPLNTEKVNST